MQHHYRKFYLNEDVLPFVKKTGQQRPRLEGITFVSVKFPERKKGGPWINAVSPPDIFISFCRSTKPWIRKALLQVH
jgi:hypothetical protein